MRAFISGRSGRKGIIEWVGLRYDVSGLDETRARRACCSAAGLGDSQAASGLA